MATIKVRDLGDYIRDQRAGAQISLRQLARQAGVSNPYLSQIERGLRKPSAEILQQIAKALRISAEALYIQAGILEEREGDGDLPQAILRDELVSERQKQVLLEIYDSFRRENEARAVAQAAEGHAAEAGVAVEVSPEPAEPLVSLAAPTAVPAPDKTRAGGRSSRTKGGASTTAKASPKSSAAKSSSSKSSSKSAADGATAPKATASDEVSAPAATAAASPRRRSAPATPRTPRPASAARRPRTAAAEDGPAAS